MVLVHQGVEIGGEESKGNDLDVHASMNANTTSSSSMMSSSQPTMELDDENRSASSSKSLNDGRKMKNGSFHRKSYSIDIKKRAIELRDSGLRIDAIAKILDTAKSNVEKWCSVKVSNYVPTNYTILYFINSNLSITLQL